MVYSAGDRECQEPWSVVVPSISVPTISPRLREHCNGRPVFTRDDLTGPDDVVEWAVAAGMVKPVERAVSRSPRFSRFEAAVALRENLYQVFGPIALGGSPHSTALSFVTRRGAQAMRSSEWSAATADMRRSGRLSPWTPSATAWRTRPFSCSVLPGRPGRVVRRGGWLFLDVSRAHARRWCSMNACGVRDKMRRYHQRQLGTVAT